MAGVDLLFGLRMLGLSCEAAWPGYLAPPSSPATLPTFPGRTPRESRGFLPYLDAILGISFVCLISLVSHFNALIRFGSNLMAALFRSLVALLGLPDLPF